MAKRQCTGCKEWKDESEFIGGRTGKCIECNADRAEAAVGFFARVWRWMGFGKK